VSGETFEEQRLLKKLVITVQGLQSLMRVNPLSIPVGRCSPQQALLPFSNLFPSVDNAKQIARIEAILLRALEADPDDPASADEIFNHLYETSLADAKPDPHHLIHHLSSVIKPPIADYTSITDCIDTSAVDRPPSPQLAHSHFQPRREHLNSNLADINDFSLSGGGDPAGRQESEMLRLAEESQHVIISQLVNKIVSMDEADEREASQGKTEGGEAAECAGQEQQSDLLCAESGECAVWECDGGGGGGEAVNKSCCFDV